MSTSTPIDRIGTISAARLGCLSLKDFSARVDWTGTKLATDEGIAPWVFIETSESEQTITAISEPASADASVVSSEEPREEVTSVAPDASSEDVTPVIDEIVADVDSTERLEAEQREREQQEAAVQEAARQEADRAAAIAETERKQAEAANRIASEKAAEEKLKAEQLAAEKAEQETLAAENLAAAKAAEETAAAAERIAAEKIAAEKNATEQAEKERLAFKQAEADQRQAEDSAAESLKTATVATAITKPDQHQPNKISTAVHPPLPQHATEQFKAPTVEPDHRREDVVATSGKGRNTLSTESEYLHELESLVLDLHRDLAHANSADSRENSEQFGWLARRVIDLSIENRRLKKMLASNTNQ